MPVEAGQDLTHFQLDHLTYLFKCVPVFHEIPLISLLSRTSNVVFFSKQYLVIYL